MFSLKLQPNEKLFKVYRQTEWVLAKTVVIIFLAVYLPLFFLLKYEVFANYKKLFFVWVVIVASYAVTKYLLWLVNSFVVTDQRLILVKYFSLFRKQVTECPQDRILNVSYKTTGIASSLLGYGNVEIQVAGLPEPMVLQKLYKPDNVKDFLWSLRHHNSSN